MPWKTAIAFVPAEGNRSAAYRTAKRAFDLIGAAALLVLLGPLMLAVLLLLVVTTRGKPLYFQRRVGYRGRTFRMIKFRTMRAGRREDAAPGGERAGGPDLQEPPRSPHHPRRPPAPQDQPRRNAAIAQRPAGPDVAGRPAAPLRPEVAQYRAWHCRRLAVMPGLTCLWQVSGRSEIGFERLGPHGPLVRPPPKPVDRLQAIIAYPAERAQRPRRVLKGIRD